MDGQWKHIYRQLKEKEITPEEASWQFKQWGKHKEKNHAANDLLPALKEIAAEVLAIDANEIHHDVLLGEQGFDPLKLNQLANRLNTKFGLELTTKDLAEQNTLDDLAQFLQAAKSSQGDQRLREKTINYLKEHLSSVFKINAEEIASDIDLEKYGINSIMVLKLTQQLEGFFGPLTKTLFFEYKTVDELTGYFLQHHREALTKVLGDSQPAPVSQPVGTEKRHKHSRRRRKEFQKAPSFSSSSSTPDIAIVGLAGRYPGARNMQEFWANLKGGKDCITPVPEERLALWQTPQKGEMWGGFLQDVDRFDPLFFHISPREAERMDPQERLFLECVYETLQDAGYTRQSLGAIQGQGMAGNVGVFVGVMYEEYQLYGAQEQLKGRPVAVNGNAASIANRVSYFCNFHGPSMAVDTMCSSSLTAIHLACQHLQRGSCEAAIAGGVNISIHPNKYVALNQGEFLSSKGRCESFGEGGDGYVPGEGVGAVLLKPLTQAVADGDHIYGVIKGTAINHGGKTHGYTVPNPTAQTDVIQRALQQAKVDPRTIDYIEAHGTGTALGDPIEIAGLTKAFEAYTQDRQFCAIGSVKSNIGHAESAAGIAGISKILLQMKYGQLVPSLHSKVLNTHIDFASTPFAVQQTLAEWERPPEGPRRAGISSFGAGGANAHVVIEEYIPEAAQETIAVSPGPYLIVLSAQSEGQLLEQAKRLLSAVTEAGWTDRDLADIAYTLQIGREAMDERLAVVVTSIADLKAKLTDIIAQTPDMTDYYRGEVKAHKAAMAVLVDEDMAVTLEAWQQKGKYDKLLKLWVKGMAVDWERLYSETKPRRISLPTYPFTRDRYWIPVEEPKGQGITEAFHPLLHQNTSDFYEQRFSTRFTGEEPFLSDHVVGGQRMLPGSAYLEMARAAVSQAVGGWLGEGEGIRLQQVGWVRPLIVGDEPVEIHMGLAVEKDETIRFDVYRETDEGEEVVYSEGRAELLTEKAPPLVDLSRIQQACGQKELSREAVYTAFANIGIQYGESHRGIERIYVGQEEVLARLTLASPWVHGGLHPGMVDAAIQAGVGLQEDFDQRQPSVPFAMEEVAIYGETQEAMWAWVRREDGQVTIVLCDDEGQICLEIKGLAVRVMESAGMEESIDHLLLHPHWQEQSVKATSATFDDHKVILCGMADLSPDHLHGFLEGEQCQVLQRVKGHQGECFQQYALQLFEALQHMMKAGHKKQVLVQVVIPLQEEELYEGLWAILQTAHLENPHMIGQLIAVDAGESAKAVAEKLKENAASSLPGHIRYQNGRRNIAHWKILEAPPSHAALPWKKEGVYLITGGLGGLGLLFAKEIAQHAPQSTLILTGRSPLDQKKEADIQALTAMDIQVVYHQIDVTDRLAVKHLVDDTLKVYGQLHGVIHSAGIIRDNFIIKKSASQFHEVMAPKTLGLVNLDLACQACPLDFFIIFSSLAGGIGNVGQADYAGASAFMDAYARYRHRLVVAKKRHGRTISFNWPLWQDGGMHLDTETEAIMRKSTGMVAMETSRGMAAFYEGLASPYAQVMVIAGERGRFQEIHSRLHIQPAPKAEHTSVITAGPGQEGLRGKATDYIKRLLSVVLKLPADQIEADADFMTYGMDSVMVLKLTQQLEGFFGSLPKTLFFEYKTVDELTGYFLQHHREALTKVLGDSQPAPVSQPVGTEKRHKHSRRRRKEFRKAPSFSSSSSTPDIAIVGLAGRYPGARNMQEFWANLKGGKDCITPVPEERLALWQIPQKGEMWGGFLQDVDRFDPLFFHISPREAERMDPQERLFLECVYETLQDAGYTRQSLGAIQGQGMAGNVGVFVGVMYEEYQLYGAQEQLKGRPVAVNGNAASIANRVSYFCNFHGPSMAVDTMCSSSLTAIHLACQHLQRGSCEAAIAGGVNISIHPNKYVALNQGEFLSSKGRCESFGEGGDGYVPGEGVGAVLLKPLTQAVADGDHIYGVIKGTAINHGGKTHGYTVPNPTAQTDVIQRALQQAKVDPRTIDYIEAHGTGTALGDPIEIAGLTKAFEAYTQDRQFCAIGSVKSNIGHAESAAGIAGISKILLQMKYGQLVPSLHSKVLNTHIDFASTPFAVQQTLAEWERPPEGPRRAGISSFGAGGANAHVVIEEYIPEAAQETIAVSPGPYLIVLSAQSEGQLLEQAKRLLSAVTEAGWTDRDLADIAYTLQIGREAMDERLAVVVTSIADLKAKLTDIIAQTPDMTDYYRGEVKAHKAAMAVLVDEDMAVTLEAWQQKGKYDKLLKLWVKGMAVDWERLYSETKPRRISLPTYPFTRDRYWIPVEEPKGQGITEAFHPLLHQNTSDFYEQRFSTRFTGEEPFLSDHVVGGQRMLPGSAYLEMARAAVSQAVGGWLGEGEGIRLQQVGWVRPLIVGDEPVEIHMGLAVEKDETIRFDVYRETDEGEEVVYSEGRAELLTEKAPPLVDLSRIQQACGQKELSREAVYTAFANMGIQYGESHRGIERIYVGQEEVLARLTLASPWVHGGLHPGMVDAAIQAGIGLQEGFDQRQPSVPFAMEEVAIYGETQEAMWAWVRREDGQVTIVLCDDVGRICLEMKGLATRIMNQEIETNAPTGYRMLAPVWERIRHTNDQKTVSSSHPVVFTGKKADGKTAIISQQYPKARVLHIDAGTTIEGIIAKFKSIEEMDELIWYMPELPVSSVADEGLIAAQEQTVIALFRVVKALLRLGYGQNALQWTIVTGRAQQVHPQEAIQPAQSALYGFAGSLAKEYPHWQIRLLDINEGDDLQPLTQIHHLPEKVLAFREGSWYHQRLVQVEQTAELQMPYKKGGVYVVIGGAGGLGEVWSDHVIRHYQAKVVWIGRREKDEVIRSKISRLAALGPAPDYIAADAANRQSLEEAYQQIKEKYGEIQGVIHSAIVLRDQRIAQMDEETFRAALTAKVNVSVRIAQVFADESLDFVLFFSSIQSFATSAGQSNYAAGCTFKDAFALAMEREWTCPVKIMNWGYWGSVGVVAEEIYQQKMAQAGIGSIEGPEGMAAVDFLLSQPCPQLAYINTLRPLHEQEIGLSETIAIYPEEINTCMANLLQEQPAEEDTAEQAILAITQRMEQGQPLLVKLLWGQLQKAGLFQNKQGSLTELTLGLQPNYRRWMKETATIFEEHKYLSWDGQAYSVLEDPVDNMAIWQEWEQFKQTWEDKKGLHSHLTLIEAALRKLPDILTGQVTATDILFPNSSIELVEGIYKQNAVADYYNQRLASILVNYLQQRQRHQKPVRILEIGAGTGGSTAEVLKRIQPYHDSIDEYAYTDISKSFLLFAEKYFGDWENRITYRMFDVTKPVVEQGIDPGGYDVVIASNVLHATPVLRETLRNTKALLKKNGLLLLIETTTHTLFNHLTFGLLDGWWLYEDEAWRIPGSPLVTVDQWERVLASEGFLTMVVPNANGQQHIILAESNGVIRQKKPTDEHPQKVEQSQQVERPVPIVAAQPIRLGESLHTACVDYMKHLAGDILRLSAEQIDSAEPLERYGFDSILVTQMTSLLRKDFSDISSTLLFEYQTLDDLADYLIKNHYQRAKDLLTFNPETDDQPVSEAPPSRPVKKKFRRKARSLQSLVSQGSQTGSNLMDVAIIGIAGRYPKANNIHEYWQLLKSGQQAVTSIPKERWDWQQYYDEEPGKPGYMYTKWGGFINGIDQFDPYFFHLSPAEAKRMDPQERLFLETCYESIADAGYTPSNLSKDRKVGVFVGAMNGHYPPGASYWSIANRVSYILNFQGPSLAVDSACSSSLTAIHLALESLYSGTSTCAVAGGVNLIVHPDHFLKLSAMTMLSPGDTCRPFSQQADGIVDSEGIGAVVLKPLEQAEVDGDHIYGVIKGSTINAGGKTNGYTVPNPHSQAKLIIEALERTKLDARTISYIEAHGTGTALGDPIEIKGLTTAFEKYTHERQFCAIGSVKSNIGHSESAAGIAGLTKVLLQLKHHQLVPSLHAEELNTRIDFSQTPFAVQQKLADWKRPVIYKDGKMQEYPRRAGISSFGAGGANAHLLIEEYIPRNDQHASLSITPDQPAIIVLSAKTEEQLRQQAIQLLTAIKQQAFTDDHLADIAYTLQTGREVMEERMAITVSSIEALRQQLDAYIQQVEDPHRISGRCSSRGVTSVIPEKSIIQWIETGAYQPLMEAWINGGAIDWHLLYQNGKPSRISLPAYPFARDRYWITEVKRDTYQDSAIHPLVHQNISDIKGLKFKTKLNEHAFYFQDHAIDSIGVLPGVAYLEMASTAAKAVRSEQGKADVCLKNVIWSKPFKQQDAQSPLIIGIVPQHNQLMAFTIYQPIDGEETIYCEGEITLGAFTQAADGLDLSQLQEQCQQRVLTSEECYQAFRSMGIVYGPHFQGIEKIYVGQRQALAKIHLPVCTADKQDAYTLHPGLLDAAIQSAVGLTLSDAGQGLALPFAMDELVLIGDCLKAEWAFVRQRDEGRGITKMDIDICDEQGDCVLLIKGLTLKSKPVQDAILFYPHWEEKVVAPSAPSFKEENGHVIIYGAEPKKAQKISDQLPDEVCHVIPYDGDHFDIAGQFVRDALQVFHIIQGILKAKPTHVVPVQILLFNQSDNPFGKALSGMLQTAHLENPHIIGQCIMLDGDMESDHVLTILHDNRQVMATPQVAYRGSQKRHALRWKEVPPSEKKESLLWKEGGVYLITGGNGGLAKIIIHEIALHIQRGVVILVGRSQPTKDMQQWLNEWQQSELKVIYRSLDVTDRQAVQRCIKDIKATYGDLNGIIHGAGVTDDHFMIQKKATQFTQVLAPKVAGVVHLDEASQDCHLDFFVIFSSITGVMGNIGQADYATANAFVDQYAYYRNSLVKSQKRQGRTFSINWPLWEDGGMQVTSQQQRQWMNDTGMVALKPEAGIRAFYQAWASPWQQVMVLAGDRDKLCRFVGEQEKEQENDATFYLTLIEQIASNELSEKEFMQLLQSHHRQVKTL